MKLDGGSREAGLFKGDNPLINRDHPQEIQDLLLQDSQGSTIIDLEMEGSVIDCNQQRECC